MNKKSSKKPKLIKRLIAICMVITLLISVIPQGTFKRVSADTLDPHTFVFNITNGGDDAIVELVDTDLGSSAPTVSATAINGVATFDHFVNPVLEDKSYDYTIKRTGYADKTGNITVGVDDFGFEDVTLDYAEPTIVTQPAALSCQFGDSSAVFTVDAMDATEKYDIPMV